MNVTTLNWINAAEKNPDAKGRYLVAFGPNVSTPIGLAYYIGNGQWQYNNITHWMPIPAHPTRSMEQ
jgi:hypothetical protein